MKLLSMAMLPLVALAFCGRSTASALVIQYDDGGYMLSGAVHGEAVRFQLPAADHSWSVDLVSVFLQEYTPSGNDAVTISIWQDNGGALGHAAVGSLVHQVSGTVGDLAWYHFDVSGGNVTFPGGGSFFAGWTSDDWLIRKGDRSDPDDRTLYTPFGGSWQVPSANISYDALIRVTVTPEPGTCAMALMAFGLAGAYVRRRRKS